MYLYKEEADKLIGELKSSLLGTLDTRITLLLGLLKEDDWSFVIKSHAYIEAVVTQSIICHINEKGLKRVVERLPLSDDQYGKLTIAKDLGLFSKEKRAFIRKLSKLRNDLAHKVENINFDFCEYTSEFDSQARKNWKNTIVWFGDEQYQNWRRISLENPKVAVWMGVFMFVTVEDTVNLEKESNRKLDELAKKTTEKLLFD